MTIIFFLIILCVIIFSHELGHFLVAKASKIKVNEFFIGMGPTLFSVTKGDTKYAIKLLPIGGACVFEGEDEAVEENSSDAFNNASIWKRIAVVVAGPAFNFLLAYLLCIIIISNTYSDKPVIQEVIPGFAAQEAGIQSGDVITHLDGERIYLSREINLITMLKQGEPLEVRYRRGEETYETVLVPKLDEETGRYLLGFQGYSEYFKCSPLQVLQYSYYEVRFGLKSTIKGMQMVLRGEVGKDGVTGPVGMAVMVGDVAEQAKPYGSWMVVINLMNLAMLLSVNLGVINLLPIPALDGGRLVFMLLELVRGKPIPPEKEGMVHFIGFALLMGLMVFVVYNDIMRLLP